MNEQGMTREECAIKEKENRSSLERIHERIDVMEKLTSSIETSSKNIDKNVSEMTKIIFGDNKDEGILTKVSALNNKVSAAYWIGGLAISALVVSLISTIVAFVFKK